MTELNGSGTPQATRNRFGRLHDRGHGHGRRRWVGHRIVQVVVYDPNGGYISGTARYSPGEQCGEHVRGRQGVRFNARYRRASTPLGAASSSSSRWGTEPPERHVGRYRRRDGTDGGQLEGIAMQQASSYGFMLWVNDGNSSRSLGPTSSGSRSGSSLTERRLRQRCCVPERPARRQSSVVLHLTEDPRRIWLDDHGQPQLEPIVSDGWTAVVFGDVRHCEDLAKILPAVLGSAPFHVDIGLAVRIDPCLARNQHSGG